MKRVKTARTVENRSKAPAFNVVGTNCVLQATDRVLQATDRVLQATNCVLKAAERVPQATNCVPLMRRVLRHKEGMLSCSPSMGLALQCEEGGRYLAVYHQWN
jgi:hypothetical protein